MSSGPLWRWLYLAAGVGLLAVILADTDLEDVWQRLHGLGVVGFGLVMTLYGLAFLADSVSWLLAIEGAAVTWTWTGRAFAVRMAGEAYNTVIPAAGLGGEPLKAEILKRRHGIGLKQGGASLVIARTVNMIALVAFLVIGFGFMMNEPALPPPARWTAAVGLAALLFGTLALFVIQRRRLTGRLVRRLSAGRMGQRMGEWQIHVDEIDAIFANFYHHRPGRLAWALGLALANWALGAAEIYVVLHYLDHPVDWTTAWLIEAAVQMIRTSAFVVPAAIGVQEGTFLVVIGWMTGGPALGIAVAAVRRAREILWVGAGAAFALTLSIDDAPSGRSRDSS